MEFEVYCDEAFPDLMTSKNPKAQYLMIGSLWLPAGLREEIKTRIKSLRERHNAWREIKWSKVSKSKYDFCVDLLDLFMEYSDNLRFRCISVESQKTSFNLHGGDYELGFYKFYYQVLHQGISDFNTYRIFCDNKLNRDNRRLHTLKTMLVNANLSSSIESIQALPSKEVALIQLADLLLGAASSRLNETLKQGTAKEQLVSALEDRLDGRLTPTSKDESKFNIYELDSNGGW